MCGVRIDPHQGAERRTPMDVQMFIYAAVAVFVLIVGIGAISGQLKGTNRKAEEHKARMADNDRKAEEHEWKRADRDSSLREKEIEMKLNEVRLQKEIALKEQEILKLQKELQYKKDHPEKFSEWHPEDED